MTGPQTQYVVTFKARNGEIRHVMVGFLTESQERQEDSLACVRGNDPELPHMTWEEFKERSGDLPPNFVKKVGSLLHRSMYHNSINVVKRKKGKTTIITITIEGGDTAAASTARNRKPHRGVYS